MVGSTEGQVGHHVSFGSIALPSTEQIQEITKALLATKRPFIWSLEKQAQSNLPLECCKHLNNCEKQSDLADCPYLIASWQPQKEILAHPATGLFIGHCGWNSTIESIGNGVPKLALVSCCLRMFFQRLLFTVLNILADVWRSTRERGISGEDWLRYNDTQHLSKRRTDGPCRGDADQHQCYHWGTRRSNGKKVNYYGNAKEYAAKAHEAISPSGKSTRDFHNFCMSV